MGVRRRRVKFPGRSRSALLRPSATPVEEILPEMLQDGEKDGRRVGGGGGRGGSKGDGVQAGGTQDDTVSAAEEWVAGTPPQGEPFQGT